jgi:tetratricopeptide (TPR) repeat protein
VDGRLEEAESCVQRAYGLGQQLCDYAAENYQCAQLSAIWRLQGRHPEALELARDMVSRNPALMGWRACVAYIEAYLGQTRHARQELERLVDHNLSTLAQNPFVLGILAPIADLCIVLREPRFAAPLYEALLPHGNVHALVNFGVWTAGPVARHLGALATLLGNFEDAEAHLEQALRMAEDMPSPVFNSIVWHDQALMLLTRGRTNDRARAIRLLNRVVEIATRHRMHGVAQRSRALAERASFRQPGATGKKAS